MKKGFTLIELMTVIGIIGLLAALLFPVLQKGRDMAHNARAKGDVKQIDTAFKAVLLDYRVFEPGLNPSGGGQDMDAAKINYLQGGNSKGIVYSEFHPTAAIEGYRDPWKTLYRVALKNSIAGEAVTITPEGGAAVSRQVAVWSRGKDKAGGTTDDVKSWE